MARIPMNPSSARSTTLIFPAVNQAAAAYFRAAALRGEPVVCAASVLTGEMPADAGEVTLLPMVYEAGFAEQFRALVARHEVERVFCPVSTVHAFLRQFLPREGLALALAGDSPIAEQHLRQRDLMQRARRVHPLVVQIAGADKALTLFEVASLLKYSAAIYGESNDDKLAAMIGIAASAPVADVVEVGCLMGRSAFTLLYLAQRFGLGPVLTADPWAADACIQSESPQALQAVVDEWDFEIVREAFHSNVALLGAGRHHHLRMPSSRAFEEYTGARLPATRPAWTGRIGLIHIDGNHDYAFAEEDCRLWLSRLAPGAWLILDDYLWAHGDGPYRVGNELLVRERERIERAFVCGKALFVHWKDR
jgi:hypothetical protein